MPLSVIKEGAVKLMLEEPKLIKAEPVKVMIRSKNQPMRGLCHDCFSSGVEITFDKNMQTICDNCKNDKTPKKDEESKLSEIFEKIPDLESQ